MGHLGPGPGASALAWMKSVAWPGRECTMQQAMAARCRWLLASRLSHGGVSSVHAAHTRRAAAQQPQHWFQYGPAGKGSRGTHLRPAWAACPTPATAPTVPVRDRAHGCGAGHGSGCALGWGGGGQAPVSLNTLLFLV